MRKLMNSVSRRRLVTSAAVVLLLGALCATASAQEDAWVPGVYMSQAVEAVYSQIASVSDGTNLGLAPGVSVYGACLQAGEAATATVQLEAGRSYYVVGGGDEDCGDLDIIVSDPDGNTVASDSLEDALPVVSFTAEADGPYTVSMQLFATQVPSFCAMAVLADGGAAFPVDCLEQSLAKLMGICNDPLTFLDEDNQFCLYGGVIEAGQSLVQGPITLAGGQYVATAAGDADMRDLDLALLGGGGDTIVRDDMDDEFPAVQFEGSPVMDYLLEVINVDSAAPSFVLCGVLTQAQG